MRFFQALGAWPDYKGLGLGAGVQLVLPSEQGCQQHGSPGHSFPGDHRGHGLAVFGCLKVLRDTESSLGVLCASTVRTDSEPVGRQGRAERVLPLRCAEFRWFMDTWSLYQQMGCVGRRLSALCACPSPVAALALSMAGLEYHPCWRGA